MYFCLLALAGPALGVANVVEIESDQEVSRTGCFKLNWNIASPEDALGNSPFLVHASTDPEFSEVRELYSGFDKTSFISGLKDGNYYYRVGVMGTNGHMRWSETLNVQVNHYSLQMAIILFSIGLVVFVAIVYVVLKGYKDKVV